MTPIYISPPKRPEIAATTDFLLARLLELPWWDVTAARREYFMSDKPRAYDYKTWDGSRTYHSADFTPEVLGVVQGLNVMTEGGRYNVCFLNRYDNQQQHLGWHADDSPGMDLDHPIAVVSVGVEREIWWKPKTHKGEIPPEWRRKLEHGSFFIMPAGFQREYLHRIPKCDHACGTRISLTFRHFIDKETATPPAGG